MSIFGSQQQPMYGNPYPQRYPQQPAQEYVTRQEFEELKEVLMSGKQPVRRPAKQPSPVADEE